MTSSPLRLALVLAGGVSALLGTGCHGAIADPGAAPGDPPPDAGVGAVTRFLCAPDRDASPTSMRRLSRKEYVHTLRDLATRLVGGDAATTVLASLEAPLRRVPSDSATQLYARMDSDLSQQHVDAFYDTAVAFAREVVSSEGRRRQAIGECAVDTTTENDAACLEAFLRRFGALAHRRPLSEDDVAFYRDDVYLDGPALTTEGLEDVIAVMLSGPRFLYHVEVDGASIDGRGDHYELSPYELASRLAYHFWQSMPDDALLAAAADGSLMTEAGYAAQVERVFRDERTRASIDDFFREWLALDDLPQLDALAGMPRFDAFAGDDLPDPELREQMIDEVLDLSRHYVWTTNGTLKDLFTSTISFARDPGLAAIYGVPAWDGSESYVHFPDGERAGVLTRAALLASGSDKTHPILKGVFIKKRILCDSIGAPPPGAQNSGGDLSPIMTARTRAETLTMQPGSQCIACHGGINPLGFATEGFDALGRTRMVEHIFDDDGSVLASLPISTTSTPRIDDGDTRVSSGAIDMSAMIAESSKTAACFSRQYFRFTYRRLENLSVDGCSLEALRTRIANGASLEELLLSVAHQPEFRRRVRGEIR